jgi:hypothetical protein
MKQKQAISGGPLKEFYGGWALMPFLGDKTHRWAKDPLPVIGSIRYFRSRCGLTAATSDFCPPLDSGSFPRCKRCQRMGRK